MAAREPEAVVLDVLVADVDGAGGAVADSAMRATARPVLMLTPRGAVAGRVAGLLPWDHHMQGADSSKVRLEVLVARRNRDVLSGYR